MFGGAYEELMIQGAIDERRLLLADRQVGFRCQLAQLARAERALAAGRQATHGWLRTMTRTVRSAIGTAVTRTPADTAA